MIAEECNGFTFSYHHRNISVLLYRVPLLQKLCLTYVSNFHLGYRTLGLYKFFLKGCNLARFSNTTQICSSNSLWEMPVCCLASKVDSSLYFFSNNVIGLATSKGLHKTIGHLDPWLSAPPCDKILCGIWDLLLLEQLPEDAQALLQHLLVIHGPEGCHCLPCDHRHQYTLLLWPAHGEKHRTPAVNTQLRRQEPHSPTLIPLHSIVP